MAIVELPYGDSSFTLKISDKELGEVICPRTIERGSDANAIIQSALADPIMSPPLAQVVRSGQKVAIIIDDISRKTPTRLMLPPIIAELFNAGVFQKDIHIIIALGTHRSMTASEILTKIDQSIVSGFQVTNIPCWDDEEMIYMGTSSKGIPAHVNRAVACADVRIGIGMITPHMDTGFSGGAKIILPGVCSCQTVHAFHSRQAKISGNQLGVINAPLRLDLEEFVGEQVGLDFILNAVINGDGSLYRCVAGDFVKAHRTGVNFAIEVYGSPVAMRYPLVISNAFPAQIDLWQSTKAIASGELMTSNGGTLIMLTHSREGNSTHPLFADYIGKDTDRLFHLLESGQAEDPVACALAIPLAQIKQRIKVCLVSSGLSETDADRMGFTYYDSIEEALATELVGKSRRASVGVLTHGGVSLPLI